jgi:hypothetical protein
MALLGAAITLALLYGGQPDGNRMASSARAGRATVSDDSDTIHLTLDVPKSGEPTHVVVRGADLKELVILDVFRDGKYSVESAPLGPVRFYVHEFPSKALRMGASTISGRAGFTLDLRPDGPSDLVISDLLKYSSFDVRVTGGGDVVQDITD